MTSLRIWVAQANVDRFRDLICKTTAVDRARLLRNLLEAELASLHSLSNAEIEHSTIRTAARES
jgi:hypothetical protein